MQQKKKLKSSGCKFYPGIPTGFGLGFGVFWATYIPIGIEETDFYAA